MEEITNQLNSIIDDLDDVSNSTIKSNILNNDYSIVNKDELKTIHLNLTDENFRVMKLLGLDLSNLKELHPTRISNLAYLMTTDNYKSQNHETFIKFANILLQNNNITEESKQAIKTQKYKPVDTLGFDIY